MSTYDLAQGVVVRIPCSRRLRDQIDRYLGAHASAYLDAAPADWTIRVTRGRVASPRAETAYECFGEACRIGEIEGGALRLRYADSPDQIWRLDKHTVEVTAGPSSTAYQTVQSVYAASRLIGIIHASQRGAPAVLHASAVWIPDGAILVCGPKGSGKTTLTLALMAQGAHYMGSDRTIAWRADEGVQVCGWTGSFRASPAAFEMVLDVPWCDAVAHYMRRRRGASAYWFAGKFRFPPNDLIRLCGWAAHLCAAPLLLVELNPGGAGSGAPVGLSKSAVEATWQRHLVPGEVPAPLAVTGLEPCALPHDLAGIRLDGRTSPREMARRVLNIAGDMRRVAS